MSKETSVDLDPIAESHQRFISAFLKADVSEILSIYSDSVVVMPSNEPSLFGKKEVEEWYHEYFRDFRIVTLEEIERDVLVFGECVVERCAYLLAIQPVNGADRIRDDGRIFATWLKQDGEWKIVQAMFNSSRPIGSGTSKFFARLKNKSEAAKGESK